MYALGRLSRPDEKPNDLSVDASPERETKPSAERIRQRALEACDRGEWQECRDGLTAARALDPQGDADPRVQTAWTRVRQALEPQKPNGDVPPRDIK